MGWLETIFHQQVLNVPALATRGQSCLATRGAQDWPRVGLRKGRVTELTERGKGAGRRREKKRSERGLCKARAKASIETLK